jgi:hypothetical protein
VISLTLIVLILNRQVAVELVSLTVGLEATTGQPSANWTMGVKRSPTKVGWCRKLVIIRPKAVGRFQKIGVQFGSGFLLPACQAAPTVADYPRQC